MYPQIIALACEKKSNVEKKNHEVPYSSMNITEWTPKCDNFNDQSLSGHPNGCPFPFPLLVRGFLSSKMTTVCSGSPNDII
jgi:hypothetical protein